MKSTAVMLTTMLALAMPVFAGQSDVKKDVREVKQDSRDTKRDRKDIAKDTADLKDDRQDGDKGDGGS